MIKLSSKNDGSKNTKIRQNEFRTILSLSQRLLDTHVVIKLNDFHFFANFFLTTAKDLKKYWLYT